MDFLDEEEAFEQEPQPRARRRAPRRSSRGGPPSREVLLRRAAALGVGLLVLILLALAVRGCLNAREDRAIRDYVRDLSSIVNETNQTAATFFERLGNRGTLSVTEFVDEVNADRSAFDNYRSRIDALGAPGDMVDAQTAIEYVYEMRASAMNTIAEQMRTALGDQGREKAVQRITRQMSVLYSSDFMYQMLVQPRINSVLEERGIGDTEAPASQIVPEGVLWLSESQVGSALGVSGTGDSAGEADDDLRHGTGLIGVSIAGVDLQPDATNVISVDGTPELTIQLQNQGEAEENDLTVSVTLGENTPLTSTLASIAAGVTESVTIPLTPTPSGSTTVTVEIAAVPGEQFLENNTATYEVDFG